MEPELFIPARALSKFVYCPRLFHLEQAQGYWRDSEETRLGSHVHRVVDRPGSGLPPLQAIRAEGWRTRSVRLSSAELGVVAVCDVVEGVGDRTCPVEYRRGGPAPGGGPWPSERAQVLLQILLLVRHGYRCDHGCIWYDRVRRRVEVPWTWEAEREVLEALSEARAVAERAEPPPPLKHSNRCPGCALLGVCMPDEINELAGRDPEPPRRLLARDPDRFPCYVTEPGSTVGVRNGRIVVARGRERQLSMRLRDVLHLVLAGPVQLSSQAVHALAEQGSPVVWTSTGGWLKAVAVPVAGKHVELRRRQYTTSPAQGVDFARAIVLGKIRNCRTLLRRNGSLAASDRARLDDAIKRASRAEAVSTLLGVEGSAAAAYFQALPGAFRSDNRLPAPLFEQTGRTRRPPLDPVSCLLSYLYALLVKDLTVACYALGLDPYFGLYHRPRYGRPALVLDLAEEFRPLIADSTALTLINNRQADGGMFEVHPTAVALTRGGRRTVITAYERRLATEAVHPVFGYKLTYRRTLEVQARMFAAYLLDEIPRYTPCTTR
ncbi:CRISPR-associated endonuclease Cas1 [Saccharopolyspora sp. 7B]|uniref:CRISPR-associated endonuclease Cas4g/Cas1g n=1 Tax=Saccharopolyspora sp. 7B TaxID=2877240 RepID=UPI001CD55795|nr:CRISPR-associated endonuclease Cas1 [Saccharopolyspora sp. 7B]MCA1278270.1 CRISPR-associated endonuclease Cas1 [Saccharopolyspora sp. 7B]